MEKQRIKSYKHYQEILENLIGGIAWLNGKKENFSMEEVDKLVQELKTDIQEGLLYEDDSKMDKDEWYNSFAKTLLYPELYSRCTVFGYMNKTFIPYRKFTQEEKDWDLPTISKFLETDKTLSSYREKGGYSYADFHKKSGESNCDLFYCIESGKLYVPCENELFIYTRERDMSKFQGVIKALSLKQTMAQAKEQFNRMQRIGVGSKTVDKNGEIFYSAAYYQRDGVIGHIYKNLKAYYKPDQFSKDEIVYIPENGFPEDSDRKNVSIDDVVGYTRQQLIDLAGSTITADVLFDALSWQSPELLWHEFCRDSEENGHWIEAGQAYEKVYLPEFDKDTDRVGQAPVCYQEFFDNEWQDEDCRKEFLDELLKKGLIHSGTVADAMKDFDEEAEM